MTLCTNGKSAAVGFALLALMSLPAAAVRQPGYAEAERAFRVAPSDAQRVRIQVMLISTGYWLAMPNGTFGERLFEAIRRFQADNGFPPNGILAAEQMTRLTEQAEENFDLWGFRKVSHPSRNHAIWIPFGLGLTAERNALGLHFSEPQHRVQINFTTVPDVAVGANFNAIVDDATRRNITINYKVFKDSWYVISGTSADGIDSYMRYHQDGPNVTGFTVSWDNRNGNVHGERIATLMSASLWSDTIGPWTIDPPVPDPHRPPRTSQSVAVAPPPVPLPATAPPPSPATTAPAPDGKPSFQSGTGFL